jgi:hypothetical protein
MEVPKYESTTGFFVVSGYWTVAVLWQLNRKAKQHPARISLIRSEF